MDVDTMRWQEHAHVDFWRRNKQTNIKEDNNNYYNTQLKRTVNLLVSP